MTGVEKIIAKIEQDSLAKCGETLAAASARAEEILAQASSQAEEASQAALERARAKAEFDIAAARSRTALEERRVLLEMKNEVIRQVIAEAVANCKALPDAAYFDALLRLAAAYAQEGPGEMRLSRRDLDRLPPDFAGKLGGLRVSQEPADIEDGFLLVYGDIEQNCTFEALVSARLDDIKDALHAHIFAREEP